MHLTTGDIFKFVASADVSQHLGKILLGATDVYRYRILSFDGKNGTIAQWKGSEEAGVSIMSLPVSLLDYVEMNVEVNAS